MTHAEQIANELRLASELDAAALTKRRQAGSLLAQARSDWPAYRRLLQEPSLDERSADLLVEMAASARPIGHAR